MARLAAIEKGEYYPTPTSVVDQIASYLAPPEGGSRGVIRLFDPCCGEGLALAALADRLKAQTKLPIETWGVEISPDRAAEARQRLDLVVEAPLQAVHWTPVRHGIASMTFLNPPYDQNPGRDRMEFEFLKLAVSAPVTGGVLVYIVPTSSVNWQVSQFLHTHFQDVQVFRFGDEPGPAGFDMFKQVVILASRRRESIRNLYVDDREAYDASDELVDAMRRYPKETVPVALPEGTSYTVPIARKSANIRRYRWTDVEIGEAVDRHWHTVEAQLAETLFTTDAELPQPLVPPKIGHIAQIVAAGLAGVIETRGKVFKGRCVKSVYVEPDPEDPLKEIARERYDTHVVSVSPEGLTHLSNPGAVQGFLQDHIELFKQYISERFRPYGNTITDREKAILDLLSLDKSLPGVSKRGLLDKQREIAVAITRAIDRYGIAHLVGEMGVGKTRIAASSVELMGAYPALVICPPQMVDKWVREVTSAIPGTEAHVVENITELEDLRDRYQEGQKLVIVMARSRIKLGSGWEKRTATRYALPRKDLRDDKFQQAVETYKAVRARLLAAQRDQAKTGVIEALRNQAREARRQALGAAIAYQACPACNSPLTRKDRLSKKPVQCSSAPCVTRWDASEHAVVESKQWCGEPLFQFGSRYHRWPLADYIRKKMRGFFKVLIADEAHQYKAKDSDQGWAFAILARHIPATITLTGTFFGGPASSIFWLLHRTQGDVRREYEFGEENRWVRNFGVLETTFKYDEDDYGALNARRKRRVSTKERPGISPGVVRYTLPTSIFVSLEDLGIALPDFREEFVVLDPTSVMHEDLNRLEAFTWAEMIEHWPRYTSAWLQWNLARPNSCFREEVVEGFEGLKKIMLPPVVNPDEGELLPKEEWLVNTVKAELAAGRRVVIYARQTGTRDIRARLVQVLEQGGIESVAVLNPNISPRKREAWLGKQKARVLITNPKLVETGLDLVQYSTVVFYEVEYSLYTLWQACRRVWRLGQTKPVRVYYLAYKGTLEDKAYALIGQKIKAAQLLYGDEVASALVEDPGDASLVMALVQAIKDGEELAVNATAHIFGDATNVVTESVVGSPVFQSPAIKNDFERWLTERGLTLEEVKRPRARRKAKVPQAQMTLF